MAAAPTNPDAKLDAFLAAAAAMAGSDVPASAAPRAAASVPHATPDDCSPAVLDAVLELAEARLNEDVPRGLAAIEVVREAVDRHGDDRRRAVARRVHARGLAMANRFGEALDAASAAIVAAEAAGEPILVGRAHMVRLHALARLGRAEEAVAAGALAREIFERAGEAVLAAKCDANLGETHRLAGDPASALACLDRACRILDDGSPMIAPLETNRGQALLDLNRFDEAEACFRRAAGGFAVAGNRVGEAIVEGNLGDLLSREGRIDGALRHFERARRFFECSGARGDLARLEAEHAELMIVRGATEDAIEAYRTALPALRRHGLRSEAARAATGLARALVRRRRFDEAASAIEEARAIHRELDHATSAGRGAVELVAAELDLAADRPADAAARIADVIEGMSARPIDAARARHLLATALRRRGRAEEAETILERALDDARALGIRPLLADLHHARGRVRRDLGDEAGARDDFRAAIEQVESIRGSLQAERFRAAFLGDRTVVYDELVASLVAEGSPAAVAEAFTVSGRARGRTLLDLVRDRDRGGDEEVAGRAHGDRHAHGHEPVHEPVHQRGGDTPADSSGTARLRTQLDRELARMEALYSRLPELPDPASQPTALAEWRDQVQAAEAAIATLEERIAAPGGSCDARPADRDRRRLDPEALRRRLAPGAVLVAYHVLADRTIAFIVDRAGIEARTLEVGARRIADLAEAIGFQIQRGLTWPEDLRDDPQLVADAVHELQALHETLLAPLGPLVDAADELIVVPHGPLHGVPFHAAHDGRAHRLERCVVRTLPAAWLLADPAAATPGTGGDVAPRSVVLGSADADAPEIAAEIEAVSMTLDRGGRPAEVDAEATRARFLALAPGATLLHVASHGRFSDLGPDSSGLRMHDGWITVRDVRRLDLAGAAVVLTGCDTGRAAVLAGDELAGLDRGFLGAGARGLVRSLWLLHDATARELITTAYTEWTAAGGTGGLFAAVRRAQLAHLSRHPHPCLWAALACVGDA